LISIWGGMVIIEWADKHKHNYKTTVGIYLPSNSTGKKGEL
jgi:hypothetical protein